MTIMFNYLRRGWHGQLRFSEVLFGTGSNFMLDGGLAYIGFYVLFIAVLVSKAPLSFDNILVLALCVYGAVFYLWFLKALWGSANHSSSATASLLIRIFTLILPLISVALFIIIIVYYILSAIIDAFS
ncbi:hypothetical protein [Legionella shakespearei]|uniref:Transmembrane protein n=2 Tax=Legionella shakespearei TaxID=45075 RepID=A0A0W0YMH3_9GAMM|nr:hypothetical protein [Legionella shakespearei]KTD57734.1 hypothetical protein Lsha_2287 [Legionella shakespearei DSM 23087]